MVRGTGADIVHPMINAAYRRRDSVTRSIYLVRKALPRGKGAVVGMTRLNYRASDAVVGAGIVQ